MKGLISHTKQDTGKYDKFRWWLGLTFGDILDKAADLYPDKEALVDSRSRLTYSQVREKANKLAISLMELGIKKKERVLLQLPNWNEFVYSYFAIQKIGAVAVLLIARHAQTEINHLCRLSNPKAWIVAENYGSIDYLPIIDNVSKANPTLQYVIVTRGQKNQRFHSLEELIEKADLNEANLQKLASRRPQPTDYSHFGPTGGSTGIPKVAAHTHNNYICKTEYSSRAWEINNNDTCLAVIPAGHDACFNFIVCGAFFNFGKIVMLDSTEVVDILDVIQKEKITCMVIVPGLLYRILNFERLQDYDVSSLAKIYVGGQSCSAELVQDVHEKLGCKFVNAYGGTEGMSTMTRLNHDPATVHMTVGRPCCPYDSYKIINEGEDRLPPNTPGELCVKGPSMFAGYFNSPGDNAKAFTQDGFFKTGDQAMIDHSGNVIITGRLKDIIKRGGENISPFEIENLLIQHPDVEAVAIVGMPDNELGERICAYIQPRSGTKPSFDEVISFLKSKGASVLQLPERVELIDSMPLVHSGKIDKKPLREDIRKKLLGG